MLSDAELAPRPKADHPSELEMIYHWERVEREYGIKLFNVFNARPPANAVEWFFTNAKEGDKDLCTLRPGKYLRTDMRHHVEKLWRDLVDFAPNLILALGNTAMWATLGENKITNLRGTVKVSPRLNIKVLPTFHPASLLYENQWKNRPIIVSDLEKARTEAEYPEVRRTSRWLTVEPSLSDIEEWSTRPAEYFAVDIETSVNDPHNQQPLPMGQITMIGFARTAHDAIVIPFVDPLKPGWNYWTDIADECAAWLLVDKILRRPEPKVFQNGIYDLSYILRAGLRPMNCQDDTMLYHHALYPELPKGLGFLGSVYSNEIAWKTMRTKGDNLKRDE